MCPAQVVHAAAMLQKDAPELRVRVVNIVDLLILQEKDHPHALSQDAFDSLFTKDKPVVIKQASLVVIGSPADVWGQLPRLPVCAQEPHLLAQPELDSGFVLLSSSTSLITR